MMLHLPFNADKNFPGQYMCITFVQNGNRAYHTPLLMAQAPT